MVAAHYSFRGIGHYVKITPHDGGQNVHKVTIDVEEPLVLRATQLLNRPEISDLWIGGIPDVDMVGSEATFMLTTMAVRPAVEYVLRMLTRMELAAPTDLTH